MKRSGVWLAVIGLIVSMSGCGMLDNQKNMPDAGAEVEVVDLPMSDAISLEDSADDSVQQSQEDSLQESAEVIDETEFAMNQDLEEITHDPDEVDENPERLDEYYDEIDDSQENPMDAETWQDARNYVSPLGYQLLLPASLNEDRLSIVENEMETNYICIPAEEENYTGLLFSITKMSQQEYDDRMLSSITPADMQILLQMEDMLLVAIFPTEEVYDNYNSYAEDNYKDMNAFVSEMLGTVAEVQE